MAPQQVQYEDQLRRFLGLTLGPEGLLAKVATFKVLLDHQKRFGDELWQAAPPMFIFGRALQVDLTLSLARLLEEPNSRFKSTSIKRFLDFASANASHIKWLAGPLDAKTIDKHQRRLDEHEVVIRSIKGQRDRGLAHLDKTYFLNPAALEEDYPIEMDSLLSLCNSISIILGEHETGLNGGTKVSGFWAGPYAIHTERLLSGLIEAKRQADEIKV